MEEEQVKELHLDKIYLESEKGLLIHSRAQQAEEDKNTLLVFKWEKLTKSKLFISGVNTDGQHQVNEATFRGRMGVNVKLHLSLSSLNDRRRVVKPS